MSVRGVSENFLPAALMVVVMRLPASARSLVETVGNASSIHFYHRRAEFEAATKVSTLLAKGGPECRAVTPSEIRAIEPLLKGDFYGGFYTASDFMGDIHKFTIGLAQACERMGVAMRLASEVRSIGRRSEGEIHLNWAPSEPAARSKRQPPRA